jgi:16S rRNA processing protein RimM
MSMNRQGFTIGKVLGVHGLKGDVKCFPLTDYVKRFEILNEVKLTNDIITKNVNIEKVRYSNNIVIIKFYGYDSINSVEKFKNWFIKITDEQALPLSADEYYVRDLYDLDVYTEEGDKIGVISEIISTGANDVYVVKISEDRELLIPSIKDCIKKVELSDNKMIVKLLEGL